MTAEVFLASGWATVVPRLYGIEVEANWEEWVRFAKMILELDAEMSER